MTLIVSPGLRSSATTEELIKRVTTALLDRAKDEVKIDDLPMNSPLVGWEGQPIVGVEDFNNKFIGRVLCELYEGPQIISDVNGLILIVSPALESEVTKVELLQRIASAFPSRAVNEIKREERKRKIAEALGGIY